MKKRSSKRMRKSGAHLSEELGPAKIYLSFWCSQDERLGQYKDQFADILKQAINDANFKGYLLTHTDKVLKERGINFGPSLTIKVVDNSYDVIHLMIPRIKAVGSTMCTVEIRDADLVSRSKMEVCRDDFNIGDNWRGSNSADLRDSGDPHNVDNK